MIELGYTYPEGIGVEIAVESPKKHYPSFHVKGTGDKEFPAKVGETVVVPVKLKKVSHEIRDCETGKVTECTYEVIEMGSPKVKGNSFDEQLEAAAEDY